jgi:hypothetical protein
VAAEVGAQLRLEPGQKARALQASVEIEVVPASPSADQTRSAAQRFRARLQTQQQGRSGERVLTSPDCAQLAHAVALVLALTLSSEPVAADTDAAVAPAPAPVARVAAAEVPRALSPGIGVDLLLGNGSVPDVAFGAGLRGMLAHGGWRAELRMHFFLPHELRVQDSSAGSATFFGGELGALGCYGSAQTQRFGVSGCIGGDLAWLVGQSRAVSEPGNDQAFWPRLVLELGVRLRLAHGVALRLAVEGARSFMLPSFAVAGRGLVFRPDAYSARAILGTELYF